MDEARKAEMLKVLEAVKAGHAGTLPNGNLVDRREHPEAVPLQKNALLGVPEPAKRGAAALLYEAFFAEDEGCDWPDCPKAGDPGHVHCLECGSTEHTPAHCMTMG